MVRDVYVILSYTSGEKLFLESISTHVDCKLTVKIIVGRLLQEAGC